MLHLNNNKSEPSLGSDFEGALNLFLINLANLMAASKLYPRDTVFI